MSLLLSNFHGRSLFAAAIYVIGASVINGLIAAVNDSSFGQQVTITVISGVITAGGLIIGALISSRAANKAVRIAEQNRELLEVHKEALEEIAERSHRIREGDDPVTA